ncbi:Ribonuclease VapC15 [Mycobacterium marinum]|uniref:Ribonuclease VapC15 n=1 Tax=Mycobacterium marinum TaxID=1781 RepID=A0A3E2MZB6_MYCMR|nr:Ribonuclease VapC15 [Mycobacterium marinum]
MIVDTSLWTEFLSASMALASHWLAARVAVNLTMVVPGVVVMELLIGTTTGSKAALRPTNRTLV